MRTWYIGTNIFLGATKQSFRCMKKIAHFTLNKLNNDPQDIFVKGLATGFETFVDNFDTAYENWRNQKVVQTTDSNRVLLLESQMSSDEVGKWDRGIRNKFDHKTLEYKLFFPNGHSPYQNGPQQEKLTRINLLSKAIGNDPDLAAVKTMVDSFGASYKTALETQKKSMGYTVTLKDLLEAQRILVGIEMQGILGTLTNHFKATPEKVIHYFDEQTIRNHQQTFFKFTIKENELLLALTHTYDVDEESIIYNLGDTVLRVALLDSADAIPNWTNKFIELLPKTHRTFLAGDIGVPPETRFLKVKNMSADTKGSFTLELL